MGGFPNLVWLSVEVPAVYTSSMMSQNGVSYYVDVTHEYGVPTDVCPMPAAELGVALADDFPLIGCCAVQCNTTCDGSLMGNGIEARSFKIPTFQLAVPIRHRQESVQEYAAEEVVNAIHFKHQAMLDLAYLYENMIMRNRSNGGYETGVEALWRYCEMFNIDIVIMYVHMGCKSMSGYHGLFEEEARKHGVHLIWVTHNLMCPEDGSRRDMRTEINRYMRTVFREEPLDPTLEDFDDSQNW